MCYRIYVIITDAKRKMLKLDLETPPRYRYCGERQFFKNEKHVSRFCPESVLILMERAY